MSSAFSNSSPTCSPIEEFKLSSFFEIDDIDAIEFFRLTGFPCPVRENWRHYVQMLFDSKLISETTFSEFLSYMKEVREKFSCNTTSYRCIYASPSVTNWMEKYVPIIKKYPTNKSPFQRVDRRNSFHGQELISIDLKEANWSAARKILNDASIHVDNWSTCMSSLGILPFLYRSKFFRQFEIGKHGIESILASLQKDIVSNEISHIMKFYKANKVEDVRDIVFVSHDEIVMTNHMYPFATTPESDFKSTIYATLQLPVGHIRYEFVYVDSEMVQNKILLKGVPSNIFYPYIRTHIMNQSLKEKDVEFMSDNRRARWIDFDESK